MPTFEFFNQHGLFAVREFLNREFCARICGEIRAEIEKGIPKQNTVWSAENPRNQVNEEIKRRAEFVNPTLDSYTEVQKLLRARLPQIAAHFSRELKDCQNIKFALYKTGDFFRQHVDTVADENAPPEIRDRKISVVIFLNDESAQKGGYTGGNLTFYGLAGNPFFDNFGMPLNAEAGLMIAFPPSLRHEVTPVTRGERYVLVTWCV